MLCALSVAVTFSVIGVGLLFIPGIVLAGRALASTTRHLAGQWCDVPDRGFPTCGRARGEGNRAGLWRRYGGC